MKKIFKILLKSFFLILLIGTIIIGSYIKIGYDMYKDALSKTPISEMAKRIEAKENYTKLEDIPKIYKDAVVAVEDHRFYEHSGIDYIAITSAIINDLSLGYAKEGGSTITQQLCKNEFFTQERKLTRKFAEIFMSAKVESELSKDKILELYINSCFYGNNCYTLKEASKLYFDKEPIELSDNEATLLAGVPNAPSLYNPIYSIELAKQRQKQVLYAMVKYNYITSEERAEILNSK